MKPHLDRRGNAVRVVTFSGVDCSGKSTQIEALMQRLQARGKKPVYLWLRVGYTPLFSAFKRFLRRLAGEKRMPRGQSSLRDQFMNSGWKKSLWLHLAFVDFAFETAVCIRLLRLLSYTVLCDRTIEDSEMDLIINHGERTAQLHAWRAVKALAARPDARIFLDLPLEESLRRSIFKDEPFPDPEETRRRRAGLYEKLKQQGNFFVIDAQMSIAEVAAAIASHVFTKRTSTGKSTEVLP